MTLQLDALKAQTAAIEKQLEFKRDDTGVHKVNTKSLATEIDKQFAVAATRVWRRIRNWTLWIFGLIGAGGTTVGAWLASLDTPKTVQAIDVQHTVEEEAKVHNAAILNNTKGVEDANQKIRQVTGIVIRLGDEQAENTEYLGRKLDAISPEARAIEPPPGVKRRKQKQHAERLDKRIDDVLGPKE